MTLADREAGRKSRNCFPDGGEASFSDSLLLLRSPLQIFTSSEEADAQRREEEAVGSLSTFTLELLGIREDMKMECNRKMDGSSDWCGRGSRRRGSSTSLSMSGNGAHFDELKTMMQSLAVGVQTSTSAANATADAVATQGDEVEEGTGCNCECCYSYG